MPGLLLTRLSVRNSGLDLLSHMWQLQQLILWSRSCATASQLPQIRADSRID